MCDERVLDVEQPDSRSLFIALDRDDDRSVQTIIVAGEIDVLNAGQLHSVVLGAPRQYRPGRIEINMFSVGFLDSAGNQGPAAVPQRCPARGLRVEADRRAPGGAPHPAGLRAGRTLRPRRGPDIRGATDPVAAVARQWRCTWEASSASRTDSGITATPVPEATQATIAWYEASSSTRRRWRLPGPSQRSRTRR